MQEVLKSVLKQLTPKQVEFMMKPDRSPFTLQVQITGPNSRFDLLKALVNGQPHKLDAGYWSEYIKSTPQKDLLIFPDNESRLVSKPGSYDEIEWK